MYKNRKPKLYLLFGIILFILLSITGCSTDKNDGIINVYFIFCGENYSVQIEKGTIINTDLIPLEIKDKSIELYYDKECKIEYDDRPVNENVELYIKIVSDEFDETELNNCFYTLQEVYDERLLNVETLKKIASYHNNGYEAKDKLKEETIEKIKEIAAHNMQNDETNPIIDAQADDFIITKYYGTYSNLIVFMINNPYFESPAEDLGIIETIAGIDFYYSSTDRILVWKNNEYN